MRQTAISMMVGTGPFNLSSSAHSYLILEKNEDYWLKADPTSMAEIQIIPDGTSHHCAGEEQWIIESTPAMDYTIIDADENLTCVGGEFNLRWIVFNQRREPWDRVEVRQAIAKGIVRQQIIDAAVFAKANRLGVLSIQPDGRSPPRKATSRPQPLKPRRTGSAR